eukprot:365704-Chlamydomonas_euryale.AAC.15
MDAQPTMANGSLEKAPEGSGSRSHHLQASAKLCTTHISETPQIHKAVHNTDLAACGHPYVQTYHADLGAACAATRRMRRKRADVPRVDREAPKQVRLALRPRVLLVEVLQAAQHLLGVLFGCEVEYGHLGELHTARVWEREWEKRGHMGGMMTTRGNDA